METHHIQKADYSKQQSMLSRKLRQVTSLFKALLQPICITAKWQTAKMFILTHNFARQDSLKNISLWGISKYSIFGVVQL